MAKRQFQRMAANVLKRAVRSLAPRVIAAASKTGAHAGTSPCGLLALQARSMASMARTLDKLPTSTSLFVNLPGTKGHTRVHADEHGKMTVNVESVQAEPESYYSLREMHSGLVVEKKAPGPGPAVKVDAHVPSHCCDVKVVSSGHVFISELTQADLSVASGGGDIKMGKVKANRIDAASGGGRITADQLTGSCEIFSQGGDVHLKTVIGTKMKFESGGGSLNLSSLYGEQLAVDSAGGPVIVEVLHVSGRSDISTSGGPVLIGGMDGRLTVTSGGGDVVVHMDANARDLEIISQGGSVSVVLPHTHSGFDVLIKAKGGVDAVPLRMAKLCKGCSADDWVEGSLAPSTPLGSTPISGKRSRSLAVVTDPSYAIPAGSSASGSEDAAGEMAGDVAELMAGGAAGALRGSLRIDAGEGSVSLGQASWGDVMVARSARNEKRAMSSAA